MNAPLTVLLIACIAGALWMTAQRMAVATHVEARALPVVKSPETVSAPETEEPRPSDLAQLLRTPPFWGIAKTVPYLHHGEVVTLADALEAVALAAWTDDRASRPPAPGKWSPEQALAGARRLQRDARRTKDR